MFSPSTLYARTPSFARRASSQVPVELPTSGLRPSGRGFPRTGSRRQLRCDKQPLWRRAARSRPQPGAPKRREMHARYSSWPQGRVMRPNGGKLPAKRRRRFADHRTTRPTWRAAGRNAHATDRGAFPIGRRSDGPRPFCGVAVRGEDLFLQIRSQDMGTLGASEKTTQLEPGFVTFSSGVAAPNMVPGVNRAFAGTPEGIE